MPIAIEREEQTWLIRLEGRVVLASAAELKTALLEWLSAGKDLELDLQGVEEIDVTALQLIFAASRDAADGGTRIVSRASGAVTSTLRDLGFDQLPGFPAREQTRG